MHLEFDSTNYDGTQYGAQSVQKTDRFDIDMSGKDKTISQS